MIDKSQPQYNDDNLDNDKSLTEFVTQIIIKIKPRVQILLDNKWSFIIFNGIVGVLAVLYLLFLTTPYYNSSVYILPDYGNKKVGMLSQFSSLASMAGINLGDAPSTQIYESLVKSETVLSDVIYAKYNTQKFDHPVNLIEYFEVEYDDDDFSEEVRKRLEFLSLYQELVESRISTNIAIETSILTVTVKMPESKLSADVANNIIHSLDNYVRTQRKSYASEQHEYLNTRVNEVKDTLSMFEERLKTFQLQNRVTTQSPELQLQETRLFRSVEIQQTVYTELLTQLELVKLEKVKDTPVVNIMEEARQPVMKSGPKRFMALAIIMMLSVIFSGSYFLFKKEITQVRVLLRS